MATEKRLIDVNKVIDEMQKCIDESAYPRDSIASYTFAAIIECLKREPTVDAVEIKHGQWEKSKRHLWYKDDGEIDEYRYTSGFHNGPVCMVCGAHFCVHCEPNYDETECYDHHYICSMCGEPSLEGHENYCPNCGADMRGDGNG